MSIFQDPVRNLAGGLIATLAALSLACGVTGDRLGPAPEFALETLDGDRISHRDCDGKVCMLAVWASWCPPCREEIPVFNDLAEEYGDRIMVIGVSVDEDREELRTFLRDNALDYPVVLAEEAFLESIGFTGILPTLILVDPEGQIRSRYLGLREGDFLRREVERHLPEAGSTAEARRPDGAQGSRTG